MNLRSTKGSAVVYTVIAAAMLVFVILPVFSAVVEKYIMNEKARVIKDAVDMANIGVYNALNAGNLGKVNVDINYSKALEIFRRLLRKNLKLDAEMCPEDGSIAEGKVEIQSLEIYLSGFPVTCTSGTVVDRPSVHSRVCVPVRPSLYRTAILKLLGKQYILLELHVDSEIPLNN